MMNDPTTPQLFVRTPLPAKPNGMRFSVKGFQGPGHPWHTPPGQAASCFVTLANSIKMVQRYSKKRLERWPGTANLMVFPRAGKQLNAYYDRRNLKFFYAFDKVAKKMIFTVDSVDIVAHELGHALLDSLRPDLWNLQALEVWGFHEAYADINAILTLLNSEEMIRYVLKETKGDLRTPNVVSKLAEEMGETIGHMTGGRRHALRNAINDFKYTPPEQLPYNAPEHKLGGECHSFGRLFLGAWYDFLVALYEFKRKEGDTPVDALIKAKHIAGEYVVRGMTTAPGTRRFTNAVVKGMLAYDRTKGKPYADIIAKVFAKRRILAPRIRMMKAMKWDEFELDKEDEALKSPLGWTVRRKAIETIKLVDHSKGLMAQSNNPLFNVEVEVPRDSLYEFDAAGNLIDQVEDSLDDVVEAARACLVNLHSTDQVGDNTMFAIQEGKLIRNRIE
jgi:Zn-dependent peptidase ImmA (M78 family)